jgi:hypothetical protein
VRGILGKIAAFVRWLFSSEQLPAPISDGREVRLRARSFVRWLLAGNGTVADPADQARPTPPRRFLTWLFSVEELPLLAGRPSQGVERRARFWTWLLSLTEKLPETGASPSRPVSHTRFFRLVVSAESCPTTRSSRPRIPGFSHWIVSGEPCPREDVSRPPERTGFFRCLLSSEDCEEVHAPVRRRRRDFFRWLLSRDEL